MSIAQAAAVPRYETPGPVSEGDLLTARAFGAAAVAAWWRIRAPRALALRRPPAALWAVRLPDRLALEAQSLGETAARLDPEQAAYEIGRAYVSRLPAAHRSANGAFYTPPPLAGRLIDQATLQGVDWQSARVLDPASGAGAFLVPAASRMTRSSSSSRSSPPTAP
jgi:adenine-specific DNA-methyltransferase